MILLEIVCWSWSGYIIMYDFSKRMSFSCEKMKL